MSPYEATTAKRLAVGDRFVRDENIEEARRDDWAWTVISHDYTARGDYSTIVESDGSDWTERFASDDVVWRVI